MANMSDERKREEFSREPVPSPIPVVYENLGNTTLTKHDLILILEEIESHVEHIRRRAFEIEEDRDSLFTKLHAFKHSRVVQDLEHVDRVDIDCYFERIYARCSTIDVNVRTIRDKPQEEALHKINEIIDHLITELQHDPTASKAKCTSFINSCSSYCEEGVEDKNFEQALLGCTADDQKRVRRRLKGLMNYIEKLSPSF